MCVVATDTEAGTLVVVLLMMMMILCSAGMLMKVMMMRRLLMRMTFMMAEGTELEFLVAYPGG